MLRQRQELPSVIGKAGQAGMEAEIASHGKEEEPFTLSMAEIPVLLGLKSYCAGNKEKIT